MSTKAELEDQVRKLQAELEALRAERLAAEEAAGEASADAEGEEGSERHGLGATVESVIDKVTPDEHLLRSVGSLAADLEEIAKTRPTLAMFSALVIGMIVGRAFSR